jgi:UPF0716 protein FxsA
VVAELVLFVATVLLVGFWPVVAWTVASGVLGAALLLRHAPRDLPALLEVWQAPTGGARGLALARAESGDRLLRTLGAVWLLLPGLLTDAAGLALCIPPVRRQILLAMGHRGPQRVRRRNEVRNRPPTGEWSLPPRAPGARTPTAPVDVLPPEVAPPTPFDDSAPVVIEVRPGRRRDS